MKGLQCLHLFAGTDELDRLPAHLADGECRPASRITVQFGEHSSGDSHLFVEGTRELGGLLTDHRIHDEQHLVRLHRRTDAHHLLHHLGVDLEATGGIHQKGVEALLFGLRQTGGGDGLWFGISTETEDLNTDLPAKGLQLFNGRRPVDICPHHQGPPPLVLEMQSEFGGGRGLTCTLQTGHQHHCRGLRGLGERGVIATHHLHELLVDHLNELLVRADAPHNLSANGLLPDVGDEILHHRKADIGLKKGTTHILQRPLNVGFADLVLASQPLDRIFKAG